MLVEAKMYTIPGSVPFIIQEYMDKPDSILRKSNEASTY